MNDYRKIKLMVKGNQTTDGEGVKLQRVIANQNIYDFDPFLMLDAFDSKNPDDYIKGFPWHPHRGIETVTYLIKGNIEHRDSLNNKGLITDNCCQWMTAGSGIMHQEMPLASPNMLGFQLWINLPQVNKMCNPKYNDILESDVRIINENNTTIRLISGQYKSISASMQGQYVDALIIDVEMDANSKWEFQTKHDDTLFIYIFYGTAILPHDENKELHSHQAVLFENGDQLTIQSSQQKLRFALFSGKALKEPIAWGGPIVMNTNEELHLAFKELELGTFIKK